MKCILIDDEPLAREGLQNLADEVEGLEVDATFGNCLAALEYLRQQRVDLIFLDIHLPGINGLQMAGILPTETQVIFVTAHMQYAHEGFELDATDYLVKPVSPERFRKAVDKARRYRQMLAAPAEVGGFRDGQFYVRADRRYHAVQFGDLLYIEGLKDYVVLHLVGGQLVTAMNLKTIHQQLPAREFARVSRSYVVNVRKITSFDQHAVYLGSKEIPIGDAYRDPFFETFVAGRVISR